uniref:Sterol O-acyltransferase 1-like isoform X1 n=1 Tax=Dermatophagoides pteronyssinus TaxID=6956 RepID=A0A6P6Y806_DERPT|nr:sterol O-acyltransferase 1-like isoform X1 [Dermatophagoides pteronyssinus]
MAEMFRLIMKSHSFYIENRNLQITDEQLQLLIRNRKQSSTNQSKNMWTIFQIWQHQSSPQPQFTAWLYFLFAPTLIYRHSYPRTKSIRWKFVVNYSLQLLFTLIFWCYLNMAIIIKHNLHQLNLHKYYWHDMFGHLFNIWIMGIFNYYCLFYTIFHLWHNITGELLRFADRHYYDSFWNVNSLKQYYRQWNIIVQEWIYYYVYLSIHQWIKNHFLTTIFVTILSAFVHEFIIALSLGFCFPLLFLLFGFGGCKFFFLKSLIFKIFYFLSQPVICDMINHHNIGNKRWQNMFFIFQFHLGFGLMTTLYLLEGLSRINCPIMTTEENLQQYFIPRMLTCITIK